MKKRFLKSLTEIDAESIELPWSRGARRARRKAEARTRALAA